MFPFWQPIVEPLLSMLSAKTIVEIGSESGHSTRRLLSFCKTQGAVLHAIDPAPKFDVEQWPQEYGDHLVLHRDLSLRALPQIEGYDAILIDGDHNWYTVYHELKLVEEQAAKAGHDLPLVCLHDVGWPYGRRDLYYDPDTIPAEHRQPFARKGIVPGQVELVDKGGMNDHLCNALQEHGRHNGVMTAVEDFVAQVEAPVQIYSLSGFSGLAILACESLKRARPDIAAFLERWQIPDAVNGYIQQLEDERVRVSILLRQRTKLLSQFSHARQQLQEQNQSERADLVQKLQVAIGELDTLRRQLLESR